MKLPKTLSLDQNYSFRVTILSQNGIQCYGELKLSPSSITLDVLFEIREGLPKPQFEFEIMEIECEIQNCSMKLFYLSRENGFSHIFTQTSGMMKFSYSVSYVLFSPSKISISGSPNSISIISEGLSPWIGRTENKLEITGSKNLDGINYELAIMVNEEISLFIDYSSTSSQSVDELKYYFKATPHIIISHSNLFVGDLRKPISECYELIEFFMGKLWLIDFVQVNFGDDQFAHTFSMYFVQKAKNTNRKITNISQSPRHAFIPLARNIRPEFKTHAPTPDTVFQRYWSSDGKIMKLVERINRFRDLSETEDGYLNSFRVLEKLTHKEDKYFDTQALTAIVGELKAKLSNCGVKSKTKNDFARRVIRLNAQKTNLEENIRDFINEIPLEMQKYIGINGISPKELATLRNDIAHGNDYQMSNDDFYRNSIQCHLLAVCALMKEMGFSDQAISQSPREMNILHRHTPGFLDFLNMFNADGKYIA